DCCADARGLLSFPTRRSSDLGRRSLLRMKLLRTPPSVVPTSSATPDEVLARVVAHVYEVINGFLQLERRGFTEGDDFHLHTLELDRKSTRLNSSHLGISYAVF